jgi:alanine racemase
MAMNNNEKIDIKVGEFLVNSGIVTTAQLQEALALQKDNPERLVGEILVTQGALTKEDLIMAMEMYLMVTGSQPKHVDEWLDQDEIDMLMDRLKNKNA